MDDVEQQQLLVIVDGVDAPLQDDDAGAATMIKVMIGGNGVDDVQQAWVDVATRVAARYVRRALKTALTARCAVVVDVTHGTPADAYYGDATADDATPHIVVCNSDVGSQQTQEACTCAAALRSLTRALSTCNVDVVRAIGCLLDDELGGDDPEMDVLTTRAPTIHVAVRATRPIDAARWSSLSTYADVVDAIAEGGGEEDEDRYEAHTFTLYYDRSAMLASQRAPFYAVRVGILLTHVVIAGVPSSAYIEKLPR